MTNLVDTRPSMACLHAISILALCVLSGDNISTLGRARSRFGQVKNPTPVFKAYNLGEVEDTKILFPEGSSERRYLVGQVPDSSKPTGKGTRYLSCESKSQGHIHAEWWIELKADSNAKVSHDDGTLMRFLVAMRLTPKANTTGEAAKALSAVRGFAAYWFPKPGPLTYCYIYPDGHRGKSRSVPGIGDGIMPDFTEPLPISAEEKVQLTKLVNR